VPEVLKFADVLIERSLSVEAERRQVAVLVADMVGFTSFSERSGEEEAFAIVKSVTRIIDEAMREQGGVVHGFTGDGVVGVFGAPIGFEDAPLRACRAALAVLAGLRDSEAELKERHGVRPELRIGINAGPAIVGQIEAGTYGSITVQGDTVNVAARLQALAEPNSVIISDATHRVVQGMVEVTFGGEHHIKGKANPQKIYRLHAIREDATPFQAAITRGLSGFVGRESELDVLERGLADAAASQLCVVDVSAEPGIGKSRLLHEFRQRIGKERAFVLSVSCSPDGQKTAFRPFIEVVRRSFRVDNGDSTNEVGQKLEVGLTTLGLHSPRNLGLLLHLLGHTVSGDALSGLDGVLLGLRTRDLLNQLLEALCRLSLVVMVIEDLQWIDRASEELLGAFIESKPKWELLLLHSRRLEYMPPWVDGEGIVHLQLAPLSRALICELVRGRLSVEILPKQLIELLNEKAEGNPLFAEEIISFLAQRGVLRSRAAGSLELDPAAAPETVPATVQSLLTARVDRLPTMDRAILQAASVIGKQFDPELLAAVIPGVEDIEARLGSMRTIDLIRLHERSGSYFFKHALVRDALYQSLLSEARKVLHLKIATEIERRSSNRIVEVAEVLAHHFSRTDNERKAFTYLAIAGRKSVSVYSLDEAATYFASALAILDKNPTCALDDDLIEFLVSYTFLMNMSLKLSVAIDVVRRHLARIDRLVDDPRIILIRHNYVFALLWNTRYREAVAFQRQTSELATRLGDTRSKAYALAGEIEVSTLVEPKPLMEFERLRSEALEAASTTDDFYIKTWARYVIGWEEIHQGRINAARDSARDLMRVGRQLNDPRATGFGLYLLAWIALISDSSAEALEYCEQALAAAITPLERNGVMNVKGCALILLRRVDEGASILEAFRDRCIEDGDLYSMSSCDIFLALSMIFRGDIGKGIRHIEKAIAREEREGLRNLADWYRGFLAEIYLEILEGNEKVALGVLARQFPTLLRIRITAYSRIRRSMRQVLANPRHHPAGSGVGRAELILGRLYKVKGKHARAVRHLTEAKRIFAQFGESPALSRIESNLASLQRASEE
jgi:class 3 adenylate cyclase/tetratricopeptide (TPR) repeat protein